MTPVQPHFMKRMISLVNHLLNRLFVEKPMGLIFFSRLYVAKNCRNDAKKSHQLANTNYQKNKILFLIGSLGVWISPEGGKLILKRLSTHF